jgi:mRNA interferase RelE/StbE
MKKLDALPREAREQIEEALAVYSVYGRGDIKRLSDREGYRMRVGRYRVIFSEDGTTILAIYVGKRETTTYDRH